MGIGREHLAPVREVFFGRFETGGAVPGSRRLHHFLPLSEGKVDCRMVSDDEVGAGAFTFFDIVLADQISDIKIMEFVACQCGSFWWIGLVRVLINPKWIFGDSNGAGEVG